LTIGPRPSPAANWPRRRRRPVIVEIKIYPEAHHSFDNRFPVRYAAERLNYNSPTGHGATTGGNAEAGPTHPPGERLSRQESRQVTGKRSSLGR